MAELLQYGRHEKQRRKAEQVAVSKDTNVYLETVETAKDTKRKLMGWECQNGQPVKEPTAEKLIGEWQIAGVVKRALQRKTDKLGLL